MNQGFNDDAMRQMANGKLPTGFEKLTTKELVELSEQEPPNDVDLDMHALALLCEMCKRFPKERP